MAVRQFSGSGASASRVLCSVGTLGGFPNGAWSILVVLKKQTGADNQYHVIMSFENNTAQTLGIFLNDANGISFENGTERGSASNLITVADGWCIVGISHASGITTPRYHVFKETAGTFAHGNFSGTVANLTGTVNNVKLGYSGEYAYSSLGGSIRFQAMAAFEGVNISDGTFETLTESLQSWLDAGATGAWPLNQTITADDVLDVTGNGANETSTSNTSVVTGDDPLFDLTLGGDQDLDVGFISATTQLFTPTLVSEPLDLDVGFINSTLQLFQPSLSNEGSQVFEPTLEGDGSIADQIMAGLISQGFNEGSLSDREYSRLLSKLTLTVADGFSIADLYALAAEPNRLAGV